jgi:hypothetical protein
MRKKYHLLYPRISRRQTSCCNDVASSTGREVSDRGGDADRRIVVVVGVGVGIGIAKRHSGETEVSFEILGVARYGVRNERGVHMRFREAIEARHNIW